MCVNIQHSCPKRTHMDTKCSCSAHSCCNTNCSLLGELQCACGGQLGHILAKLYPHMHTATHPTNIQEVQQECAQQQPMPLPPPQCLNALFHLPQHTLFHLVSPPTTPPTAPYNITHAPSPKPYHLPFAAAVAALLAAAALLPACLHQLLLLPPLLLVLLPPPFPSLLPSLCPPCLARDSGQHQAHTVVAVGHK